MLLVKSQFSKYDVVEIIYSLETARNMIATAYPRLSMDAAAASPDSFFRNIVQHRVAGGGFSNSGGGGGGRNLSSIQLFVNRMRGSGVEGRRQSSLDRGR